MARYLRDRLISNRSIDLEALSVINTVFVDRAARMLDIEPGAKPQLLYTIRFDAKGYRAYTYGELETFYRQAKVVERVIFRLDSEESRATNGIHGSFLELGLDANDMRWCVLVATSESRDWTEASFSAIDDVLGKFRAGGTHRFIRTIWTELLVRIFGVFVIFGSSWAAAYFVAFRLGVKNSFQLAFFFSLVLASQVWQVIDHLIKVGINSLYPNNDFLRPEREQLRKTIQGVLPWAVGAVGGAILTWAIDAFRGAAKEFFQIM